MADGTHIEWTDATWNPITGCSIVSPGCTNCYAMRLAGTRLQHHRSRAGLTRDSKAGPVWTGEVKFNEEWLLQPLQWRRPRMIFVCAHGDLFHENVPDEWIDRIFAVMALCPQHKFQVLTKRPERMRDYLTQSVGRLADIIIQMRRDEGDRCVVVPLPHIRPGRAWWPLANVWLGVSVEDQAAADQRIPLLVETPAQLRFLSCEPLLGPVTFEARFVDDADAAVHINWLEALDWVIAGGESGRDARPSNPQWFRVLRDQCAATGVPFFFKQWGEWAPDHGEIDLDKIMGAREIGWQGNRQIELTGPQRHRPQLGEHVYRVGKKAAGRLLDGVEHNGMPNSSGGIQQ